MNNNEYCEIRLENISDNEQIICLNVYGLPYLFVKNISFLLNELKELIKNNDGNSIESITFIDIDNLSIGLEIIRENKLYDNLFIVRIVDYHTNKIINLKSEIGYEIINKLKEMFGDELNE